MGGLRTGRLTVPIAGLLIATACWATGAAAAAPASTWSITAGPHRSGSNNFQSISCVTADDCVAVGLYGSDDLWRTMAQTWNGSTWSSSATRNVGTGWNWLNGVSCVSATFCMAVGFYEAADSRPLAEVFDGTHWTRLGVPRPPFRSTATLASVSCVSTTFCMAVGEVTDERSTARYSLIESWDGVEWHALQPANVFGSDSLVSVSCSSSTRCAAVGSRTTATAYNSLIETWDGVQWLAAQTDDPGTVNGFNAVSCPTATRCVAVGDYYGPHGTEPTLIAIWDGTNWTYQSTPTQGGAGINWLNGVSCSDASDCVAVGGYNAVAGQSQYRNLLLSWDGTAWSVVSVPHRGHRLLNDLVTVSCPAPGSCRAIGAWQRTGETDLPLHLTETPVG